LSTEADTCRRYVVKKIYAAGWNDDQISEQKSITHGRILTGKKLRRMEPKRPDYILHYKPNQDIAVIEAKAEYKKPADGLQQAIEYAQMLDVKFAYSTNGHGIVEHDFITGKESTRTSFPPVEELWQRLREAEGIDENVAEQLQTPYYNYANMEPRYYQEVAINRAFQAILKGRKRSLLTLATGTGKTFIAFQLCWRLWNARWNRAGEHRRPRVLYLSDRTILIDDPKDKTFAPFGDARHRIRKEAIKSREIYFATYQSIAEDDTREGVFREYPPDFFDLIIVDECHRGSASDDSNWRSPSSRGPRIPPTTARSCCYAAMEWAIPAAAG